MWKNRYFFPFIKFVKVYFNAFFLRCDQQLQDMLALTGASVGGIDSFWLKICWENQGICKVSITVRSLAITVRSLAITVRSLAITVRSIVITVSSLAITVKNSNFLWKKPLKPSPQTPKIQLHFNPFHQSKCVNGLNKRNINCNLYFHLQLCSFRFFCRNWNDVWWGNFCSWIVFDSLHAKEEFFFISMIKLDKNEYMGILWCDELVENTLAILWFEKFHWSLSGFSSFFFFGWFVVICERGWIRMFLILMSDCFEILALFWRTLYPSARHFKWKIPRYRMISKTSHFLIEPGLKLCWGNPKTWPLFR